MPGFTLIYQYDGLDESVRSRAERLVNASFKTEFITKTETLMILFRDGNHYPYEVIEFEGFLIFVEGKIYDFNPDENLAFKQQAISSHKKTDTDYFHHLDGEFVIYVINPENGRVVIINDFLGRLPLYHYQKRQFILSRDMYVLDKVTTGLMFDDSAVYQYLRLGYPLGKRTLYHDIFRLPPSSFISIDAESVDIQSVTIPIEEMEGSNSQARPEEALYELFKKALNNRVAKENKVVVSLSGGLDSRVIMGEFEKNNLAVDYASFLYENTIIKSDIDIVKQLGKLYKRTPEIHTVQEYAPEFFGELTKAKGGMNYLGMAFILGFLKSLDVKYNMVLTGDGGDKTIPFLFPDRKLISSKLSKLILKKNAISTKRSLDSFLVFEIDEEEKLIADYLNELPGSNSAFKYKNYLLFERTVNWLFEGEDRNRSYIWSTSPFYQPEFFKLVHSIPEIEKKNYKLFRSFSRLIDPSLNKIPNANWGIPLEKGDEIKRMIFKQKIKSFLPKLNWGSYNDSETHLALVAEVTALMQNGYGGQLSLYADRHDLISANDETLYHLITLLKVSEMTWNSY